MSFYRRRLPHWVPNDAIVLVTWRLAGSPPPPSPLMLTAAGLVWDDPADRCREGPFWLQDTRIASLVRDAFLYGEIGQPRYSLIAWVIMPNHVHLILEPWLDLAEITRWLKGRTARLANRALGRTGESFWQDESFDHWVRPGELRRFIEYVEHNPVKAGLVLSPEDWPFGSARQRADDAKRSSAPLD